MSELHGNPKSDKAVRSDVQLLEPTRWRWWHAIGLVALVLGGLFALDYSKPLSRDSLLPAPTVTQTVTVPPLSREDQDEIERYASFRLASSYVGEIGNNPELLSGVTYYLPRNVRLVHDGNDQWYISEMHAPILRDPRQAGTEPLTLRAITEPPNANVTDGGAGLQITLPRLDQIQLVNPGWERAVSDVRDPAWRHQKLIAMSSVLPAPGYAMDDYYGPYNGVLNLHDGQSGYVLKDAVKLVAGTNRGYLADTWYRDKPDTPLGQYVKVTETRQGYTVCLRTNQNGRYNVYQVPADFTPVATAIPFRIAC